MNGFKLFFESDNEIEWHRLFDHILKWHAGKGPLKDPQYHDNLVRLLRNVGLDDLANETEMIRISQKDIDTGNTPMYGGELGRTIGDVLKHQQNSPSEKDLESFRVARRTYSKMIDHITKILEKKVIQMGWKFMD